MSPLISVIIPIWNVEKYLAGCMQSVISQSYRNLEIICINDGSQDGSAKILQRFANEEPRIVIITQDNQGLSGARNSGIEAAHGDYIFFLDSDDYLHPQALEILLNIAEKSGCDLSICSFEDTEQNYKPMAADKDATTPAYEVLERPFQLYLDRDKRVTCTVWNRLYRRRLLTELRFIKEIVFEDVPFSTCLLAGLSRVAYTPEALCFYFVGGASITRSNFSVHKIESYAKGLEAVNSYFEACHCEHKDRVKISLISWYVRVMINAVRKEVRKQDNQADLIEALKQTLRRLYKNKIIGFRGLSWGKKLNLFYLLHF